MICVLDVIDGPARGKRIWLKQNQCIEIGRISTADFSIPADTHLSRRHLLLDSTQNGFRIRDVGSANGTFLNNVRIMVQELKSGDTVRAGLSTFAVTMREDGENPHSQDGVTFSRSMSAPGAAELTVVPPEVVRLPEPIPEKTEAFQTEKPAARLTAENGVYRTLDFSDRVDLESTVRIPAESLAQETLDPADFGKSAQKNQNWWKAFFKPIEIEGVYEQSEPFSSPHGNFLGLMHEFESEFQLILIVNESQLPERGRELIDKMRQSGAVRPLSRSLCYLKYERNRDLQKLVEVSSGEDALICIGVRHGLPAENWEKYANSLSYPSMFASHLKQPSSKLKEFILKTGSFSLFEANRDGNVALLMSDAPQEVSAT